LKPLRLLILIVSLVLPASTTVLAQTGRSGADNEDRTTITDHVFGAGVNFSLVSGSGFSFRHHLPYVPVAYQISGFGWSTESLTSYNIGVEVQYDFFLKESGRFYALVGMGHFYHADTASFNKLDDPQRFGLGVGYEVALSDMTGFSINTTFTYFSPSGHILPLPYAGLHFYFR
jgi:hypothetical protein